ncbi:MAG: hypothetical protein IJ174_02880, partial [Clostridia bacterium]|nr:hypothetical protein [Clostridia bacterium]
MKTPSQYDSQSDELYISQIHQKIHRNGKTAALSRGGQCQIKAELLVESIQQALPDGRLGFEQFSGSAAAQIP